MVNVILAFCYNKNVISVKCSDVEAERYQLYQKTDKEATQNIINLAPVRLQKMKGEWSIRDPYQPMDRTTAHWGGGVELGTGGRPFEVMPSCICMKDWILGTPIY